MGVPDGIEVDAPALHAAGSAVQSVGARLGGAVRTGQEGSVQPAGDGHGWAAWAAMCTAGAQWTAELKALATAVAATGDDIMAAADGYTGTDTHSATRFGRVKAE